MFEVIVVVVRTPVIRAGSAALVVPIITTAGPVPSAAAHGPSVVAPGRHHHRRRRVVVRVEVPAVVDGCRPVRRFSPAACATGAARRRRGVASRHHVPHVEATPGQARQVAAVRGDVVRRGDVVGRTRVLLVLRVALGAVLLLAGFLS